MATYSDDASGAKIHRPGLDAALTAARAGLFDVLLVYRVDRFTRRIRDLVTLLDDLDEVGIVFRSATEPIDTATPAGRMLVQMLGVFAEFERETIIDRVIGGMERQAAKGQWGTGACPYGYTRDPQGHLSIHEPEAAVVREIFRLYTRGRLGTRAVAATLNDRGSRSRSGRPWSHKTVGQTLLNRVYTGEIRFREVTVPDAHPAIIEATVFAQAQQILTERGENPAVKAGASSDYHLTGKIICPRCGRSYLGTNATGRTRTYRYYTCFTRSRYGTSHCDAPRLDADRLDAAALRALGDFYATGHDLIAETLDAVEIEQVRERTALRTELDGLTGTIAAKEAVIDRYLADYETNRIDQDTVARRVKTLSEELRALRHRRDQLTYTLATEPDRPDQTDLDALRTHITQIITEGTTPERKALCEKLIDQLRIEPGHTGTFVFKIPVTAGEIERLTSQNEEDRDPQAPVRERPQMVRRQGLEPRTR